ncbi:PQQ-binding-like beta-propeller repeat protein [Nakamurella sp. PAMC28650]|nr:PQQ-binding-like beta-propeller repeat protein [Nakamurella sp. PAMC28650]
MWRFKTGGPIATSAAVVGGTTYIGSWDGYEYAIDAGTGALKWKTYLGITSVPGCSPATAGVSSSATVQNGVVYVGGGDQYWYALDATSGAVLWKVFTGDNSPSGGHYNWASPLLANGFAYIGVSSLGDCPLVPGQLLKVDLTTGQVAATWNAVASGRVGGGVWTSPTLDQTTNTIFLSTGTEGGTEPLAQALIALDATSLSLKDSWKLPAAQAVTDSDFGTTPLLFVDANGRTMVGSVNKNGVFYAFDRANLSAGPLWQTAVAVGGTCPTCGDGSVSSGAFASGAIFQAGGTTTISGASFKGSVRSLDPATGAFNWQHGESAPVIPAIAYTNGMIVDAAGPTLEVLNASTGAVLYSTALSSNTYGPPSVANGVIFANSVDGTVYAFAPTACPVGWGCADVGAVGVAGSQALSGSTWTVAGGGADISGTADAFHFVSQSLPGDGAVSGQVTAQQASNSYAKAGVMLRSSSDPAAPYYAALITPQYGIRVQYRSTLGGGTANAATPAGTVPAYLRVTRAGTTFTAFTSTDGVTWTPVIGSAKTVTALGTGPLLAGMAVSSHNVAALSPVTFDGVAVTPTVAPAACPVGWGCADVGAVGVAGSQALSGSTWTVAGGGADISGTADAFHFVSQSLPGDGAVSGQVTAQQASNSYAKAGVMLRSSSDPAAPYYAALITPQYGIRVQYRSTLGGGTANAATPAGTVPAYLRVTRAGTTFTAFTSTDGVTWTPVIGSAKTVTALGTGPLLAGMAVSSHNVAALSPVTFDGVAVTPTVAPAACPVGWGCADVGAVGVAGSQALSGSTWTVAGGGADISGTADAFHFVSQSLPGDGAVSGQVTAQQASNSYAKAGVMLRSSSDPAAPYYAALITPQYGIRVQYRSTLGGGTANAATPAGTVPAYLRVTRAGTTFTAFTSTDGVTWTPVIGSAKTVTALGTGPLLAGMAVSSHNNTTVSQVTYAGVSIG